MPDDDIKPVPADSFKPVEAPAEEKPRIEPEQKRPPLFVVRPKLREIPNEKPVETKPAALPEKQPEQTPEPALPKKFLVGEDRRKEREENILYNWMILALIIGIIIVIITLILARPAPEYFSELYFENHKSLLRYIGNNIAYDYSFTIANHLNSSRNYTIYTARNLYRFNYSCESPAMYFDSKILSTEAGQNLTLKWSETTDPVAYIRTENYTLSFEYRIKPNLTGRVDYINISLRDLEGTTQHMFVIDPNSSMAYYYRDGKRAGYNFFTAGNGSSHSVWLTATKTAFTLSIDKVAALKINQSGDYTRVFPYFEITGINAELPWVSLKKGSSTISNLFKAKSDKCALIPLKVYGTPASIVIEKDKNASLRQSFMFNETFDIAKVQVELDSKEEIHFWVNQI